MTSCAYTSAMVLLAANNLYNTRHDRFKQEIELIDGALLWLNEAMREFQSKEIKILRDTCVEAVRAVKRKHAEDIPMSNWQRLIE
jgi:predicted solute-binding protein